MDEKPHPQRYDITLKGLLHRLPPRMMALLGDSDRVELLDTAFPEVQARYPDLVMRTPEGALKHYELQSDNYIKINQRMLNYCALIRERFDESPEQTVLYVGEEPMRMPSGIDERPKLWLSYRLVDLREFAAQPLLESPAIADNLLAILCAGGDTPEAIGQIVERIRRLPAKQQRDELAKLLILSGLRHAQGEVKRHMPITVNLMENEVIREFYEQGYEKGREEARQEGELSLARYLLERKFGVLPQWAADRIQQSGPEELKLLAARIADAQKLEDVFSV